MRREKSAFEPSGGDPNGTAQPVDPELRHSGESTPHREGVSLPMDPRDHPCRVVGDGHAAAVGSGVVVAHRHQRIALKADHPVDDPRSVGSFLEIDRDVSPAEIPQRDRLRPQLIAGPEDPEHAVAAI